MNHLKKSNTGHLIKNSDGHLVNAIAIPDYLRLEVDGAPACIGRMNGIVDLPFYSGCQWRFGPSESWACGGVDWSLYRSIALTRYATEWEIALYYESRYVILNSDGIYGTRWSAGVWMTWSKADPSRVNPYGDYELSFLSYRRPPPSPPYNICICDSTVDIEAAVASMTVKVTRA